jgi:hypothetical protein
MSWLKWALIGIGGVVVLTVAMLAMLGTKGDKPEKEVRHLSVGQRTISVSHYKDMTQETTADGVKIVADGHVIVATPDSITIDGTAAAIDASQDVEIVCDETGKSDAKGMTPEEEPAETAPE